MCACVCVSPKAPDDVFLFLPPLTLFVKKRLKRVPRIDSIPALCYTTAASCLLTFVYEPRLFDMISDCYAC